MIDLIGMAYDGEVCVQRGHRPNRWTVPADLIRLLRPANLGRLK
jgi:hypothetical protein